MSACDARELHGYSLEDLAEQLPRLEHDLGIVGNMTMALQVRELIEQVVEPLIRQGCK